MLRPPHLNMWTCSLEAPSLITTTSRAGCRYQRIFLAWLWGKIKFHHDQKSDTNQDLMVPSVRNLDTDSATLWWSLTAEQLNINNSSGFYWKHLYPSAASIRTGCVLEMKGCDNLWHVYGWPINMSRRERGTEDDPPLHPYSVVQIYYTKSLCEYCLQAVWFSRNLLQINMHFTTRDLGNICDIHGLDAFEPAAYA